jgi:hypothetical protein
VKTDQRARLIKWAGTSTRTRAVFYSQIFTKIVPLNLQAEVKATVAQNNDEPRQALERILTRIVEQRR